MATPEPHSDAPGRTLRKPRRGSYIIRLALRRAKVRQDVHALKAAARMVLALPVVQGVLIVVVLNAEPWLGLLAVEGLLIAWLAAAQLSRQHPESKLLGYGIAFFNVTLLGAAGAFFGVHALWVTGVVALAPISWLVFARTKRRSVRRAWLAYALPLALVVVAGVLGRAALVLSESEDDPGRRLTQLQAAEVALAFRGGNGTERALIGLRQAQAAFEAGDYQAAFQLADSTLYNGRRELRGIPESVIGSELLDSLMRIKAQAFYNMRWGKDAPAATPIKPEPLPDELLDDPSTKVRWGW